MIERYSITAAASEIAERFSLDVPEYYKPRYNAAPTQLLPVITSSDSKGLSLFYWGTSPEWSKNKALAEKIINIRKESFEEKPALKRALFRSRCIVPADGFYGWKRVGKKTIIPYLFALPGRKLFSFAGLWEEFEDTDGNQIHTFSIITSEANSKVSTICERMPLILNEESQRVWLDAQASEENIMNIVNGKDKNTIDFYPVSPMILNASYDLPSMIIPTPPADQHGNLTLFD
jgi:putative SOS response-associated peptidase YedK